VWPSTPRAILLAISSQSWQKIYGRRFFSRKHYVSKRLCVFAIMNTTTRQIIAVVVTKNPTAGWLETVIRNAFKNVEKYPPFMVPDRDGFYSDCFSKFLSECYGIIVYRTPPRTPNCNAFIERWNRKAREDLLDHRIIFGERDLRRLLNEHVVYFNKIGHIGR
jgi:hypothetical protein